VQARPRTPTILRFNENVEFYRSIQSTKDRRNSDSAWQVDSNAMVGHSLVLVRMLSFKLEMSLYYEFSGVPWESHENGNCYANFTGIGMGMEMACSLVGHVRV